MQTLADGVVRLCVTGQGSFQALDQARDRVEILPLRGELGRAIQPGEPAAGLEVETDC